jgi:hypothetical protein
MRNHAQPPESNRHDGGRPRRNDDDFDERGDDAAHLGDGESERRRAFSRGEYGDGYDPSRDRDRWRSPQGGDRLEEQRPYRGLDREEPTRGRYGRDFGERDEPQPGRFERSRAYQTTRDEEDMRERHFGAGSWSGGGMPARAYESSERRENPFDHLERGSHESRRYGAPPRGYQRSEQRLREDICDALMRRPELDASDVEVKVEQGEVTLEGSVRDRRQKLLIEQVCDSILGVQDVTNHLRVKRASL